MNIHSSQTDRPGIKQGALSGAALGFKLALGYAVAIAVLFSMVTLSPAVFFLTLFSSLIMGLVPAIVIGVLAGVVISFLFSRSRELPSEWRVVGIGWAVGIVCALLLPLTVVFLFNGIDITLDEFFEIIGSFGVLLLCPSVITIFAIGWLARKLSQPVIVENSG